MVYNSRVTSVLQRKEMRNFYYIIIGGTGIYLIAQLFAYLVYGKIFFRNTGVLFDDSKNKFQWQTVFPKNLLLFIVFLFVSALFGLLLDFLGAVGWLSLPLGTAGGLAVNFVLNAAAIPRVYMQRGKGTPTDRELDGAEGLVLEDIYPMDYGKIEIKNGGRPYVFDAICANGKRILSGERVIVIYAEEGLCIVESADRFCDVLFEDEPPMTNTDEMDFKND